MLIIKIIKNPSAELALEAFLSQLVQEEPIEEVENSSPSEVIEVEPNTTNQPFTTPSLEVYTDMQEPLCSPLFTTSTQIKAGRIKVTKN